MNNVAKAVWVESLVEFKLALSIQTSCAYSVTTVFLDPNVLDVWLLEDITSIVYFNCVQNFPHSGVINTFTTVAVSWTCVFKLSEDIIKQN